MQVVSSAPEWLLKKINKGNTEKTSKVAIVLWAIWFWHNKKVWEDKVVSPALAVDWSLKMVMDWRKAVENKSKQNVIK